MSRIGAYGLCCEPHALRNKDSEAQPPTLTLSLRGCSHCDSCCGEKTTAFFLFFSPFFFSLFFFFFFFFLFFFKLLLFPIELERGMRLFKRNLSLPLHLSFPFTLLGRQKREGSEQRGQDLTQCATPATLLMSTAKSISMEGAYDKTAVPRPDAHIGSWIGRRLRLYTDIQLRKSCHAASKV